jgi:hypothetical protein
MMHMGKRKGEKEVGLHDILQELKKQTYINFVLSIYVIAFTVAILVYEWTKVYWETTISALIAAALIMLYINHKLKKYKLN